MPRLTPITLNRAEHSLYYTVSNVIKINRVLRSLERLGKEEDTKRSSLLVGTGDVEVIAVFLQIGLEHEKNPELTNEKLIAWLDEVMYHRKPKFFREIQLPILKALRAAGQIDWDIDPAMLNEIEDGAAVSVTSATDPPRVPETALDN